ncbi:hypothetical protein P22_0742 [Propionispora sp. 2/2-37]|uniref:hypothetical protein n=1 Tax=Propionispora sp. 2/2-37 TaxID=1677858 RepID=UPI0006BB56C2|nr:hypothetical protein [Propionispora sp. 2/2-37]CUH94676.1 hypothetical protein P22_0742 [Propionispora sp. 2/2-37]
MIYEMMRAMAGPYVCSVADAYIAHQDVLNSIVVAGGIAWLVYDRKYRSRHKTDADQKANFYGLKAPEKR